MPHARAVFEHGLGVWVEPQTLEVDHEARRVAVGGPRLLADLGLAPMPETGAWADEGRTVLHVVADGRVIGALALEDEIRPESAEAVRDLHRLGLKVAMITGDSQAVADSVA